jgi:putative endonuclease
MTHGALANMVFYVYIILCMDGSFYTGYTKNIDARARLHAHGKGARYTRMHKPKRVAYTEVFDSRGTAMKREKEIKRLTHQQKLDLTISQKKKGSGVKS